jgi:hypothetical protein
VSAAGTNEYRKAIIASLFPFQPGLLILAV